MMQFRWQVLVMVVALFAGSAMGDGQIQLRNSNDAGMTPDSAKRVVFAGLQDKRAEGSSVAQVQNSFGEHVADWVAINDVGTWVNKEIEIQLGKKGYRVLGESSDSSIVRLTGQLFKVQVTAYTDCAATVSFFLRAERSGLAVLEKKYRGFSESGERKEPLADKLGRSLDGALQMAIGLMLADLDSLGKEREGAIQSIQGGNHAAAEQTGTISGIHEEQEPISSMCPAGDHALVILKGKRSPRYTLEKLKPPNLGIREFYFRRYSTDPNLQGNICLLIKIDAPGKVLSSEVIYNTLNDQPTEEIIKQKIGKIGFYPIKDTTVSEVVYSLHFKASEVRSKQSAARAGSSIGLLLMLFFNIFFVWPLLMN